MRTVNPRAALALGLVLGLSATVGCGDDDGGGGSKPTVVSTAGNVAASVDTFRTLLGEPNNGGTPGTQPSGRREINWDGVADELSSPNFLPPDFFNGDAAPRARGAFFATPGDGVQVSADSDNPSSAAVRFGNINPSYSNVFQTFSAERLFSPIGSNVVDMTFFVPGTSVPATVTGFGAVYTDVDFDDSSFEFFGVDGESLGRFEVPANPGGLSFLGVVFADAVVARVRIAYGTTALGPNESATVDVAVMDDFFYGEPQAIDGFPDTPQALRESIPKHGADPEPQAETTYVGYVEGSEALIAVVSNDAAATAYICDGREISEWFLGTPAGSVLQLQGDKGGNIDAELTATGVDGSVTHADATYSFATEPAFERENGIYRSVEEIDGERIVSGWIFYDGELRGADEDSGKSVVGSISLSGIDDATGSGTGLGQTPPPPPTPAPLPQFVCGELFCTHENLRCSITFYFEEREKTKSKEKKATINAMIKAAQKKLSVTGDELGEYGCIDAGFSCPGSGYDSVHDTPCCSVECP